MFVHVYVHIVFIAVKMLVLYLTLSSDIQMISNCQWLFPFTGGTPETCPAGQIRCKNGDCVVGKLCDGLPECYDGSDEDGCGKLIL